MSFAASLVRSLAWPAAVVTGVVVLRRPLVGWLAVPPRRVKVGPAGVEAEWPEQAARVVGSLTAGGPGGEQAPQIALINGRAARTVSVLERGLHYGDGLFETIA